MGDGEKAPLRVQQPQSLRRYHHLNAGPAHSWRALGLD